MQVFRAEILETRSCSSLLKAPFLGYPSLKHWTYVSQWALLQFLRISATLLLAVGARNIESCPEGSPTTAWDGGGGKRDPVGHQHLGITVDNVPWPACVWSSEQ